MAETKEDKLSEIYGKTHSICGLHPDKKIIFSPMSLETIVMVEDDYGSFKKWQEEALQKGNIKAITYMLWALCLNKEDFNENQKMFMRNFPATGVYDLQAILGDILKNSMPPEKKATGRAQKKK